MPIVSIVFIMCVYNPIRGEGVDSMAKGNRLDADVYWNRLDADIYGNPLNADLLDLNITHLLITYLVNLSYSGH